MSGLQDAEIAVVVRGVGVVLLQCVPVSQAADGHGVEINSSDRTYVGLAHSERSSAFLLCGAVLSLVFWRRMAGAIGGYQEPTLANEMCEMCPSLTFQQRLIGFGICLVCGYLLSFLSTISVVSGDLTSFALIYCLGSLIAISATA